MEINELVTGYKVYKIIARSSLRFIYKSLATIRKKTPEIKYEFDKLPLKRVQDCQKNYEVIPLALKVFASLLNGCSSL